MDIHNYNALVPTSLTTTVVRCLLSRVSIISDYDVMLTGFEVGIGYMYLWISIIPNYGYPLIELWISMIRNYGYP